MIFGSLIFPIFPNSMSKLASSVNQILVQLSFEVSFIRIFSGQYLLWYYVTRNNSETFWHVFCEEIIGIKLKNRNMMLTLFSTSTDLFIQINIIKISKFLFNDIVTILISNSCLHLQKFCWVYSVILIIKCWILCSSPTCNQCPLFK